jgi:hypothetical protein
MALPPQCEVVEGFLVFRELAHPDVLGDTEALFEHTCFIACTNALRPLGYQEVDVHPFPELGPDEYGFWGGARFDARDVEGFRAAGYVLAEIRLPAQPMGLPVPSGSIERPPGTA